MTWHKDKESENQCPCWTSSINMTRSGCLRFALSSCSSLWSASVALYTTGFHIRDPSSNPTQAATPML
eukprot:c14168_g1_i1 orf=130-333(-)